MTGKLRYVSGNDASSFIREINTFREENKNQYPTHVSIPEEQLNDKKLMDFLEGAGIRIKRLDNGEPLPRPKHTIAFFIEEKKVYDNGNVKSFSVESSSHIEEILYENDWLDTGTSALLVEFTRGPNKVYAYFGVSEDVYDEFQEAAEQEEAHRFFVDNIKGFYGYEALTDLNSIQEYIDRSEYNEEEEQQRIVSVEIKDGRVIDAVNEALDEFGWDKAKEVVLPIGTESLVPLISRIGEYKVSVGDDNKVHIS